MGVDKYMDMDGDGNLVKITSAQFEIYRADFGRFVSASGLVEGDSLRGLAEFQLEREVTDPEFSQWLLGADLNGDSKLDLDEYVFAVTGGWVVVDENHVEWRKGMFAKVDSRFGRLVCDPHQDGDVKLQWSDGKKSWKNITALTRPTAAELLEDERARQQQEAEEAEYVAQWRSGMFVKVDSRFGRLLCNPVKDPKFPKLRNMVRLQWADDSPDISEYGVEGWNERFPNGSWQWNHVNELTRPTAAEFLEDPTMSAREVQVHCEVQQQVQWYCRMYPCTHHLWGVREATEEDWQKEAAEEEAANALKAANEERKRANEEKEAREEALKAKVRKEGSKLDETDVNGKQIQICKRSGNGDGHGPGHGQELTVRFKPSGVCKAVYHMDVDAWGGNPGRDETTVVKVGKWKVVPNPEGGKWISVDWGSKWKSVELGISVGKNKNYLPGEICKSLLLI